MTLCLCSVHTYEVLHVQSAAIIEHPASYVMAIKILTSIGQSELPQFGSQQCCINPNYAMLPAVAVRYDIMPVGHVDIQYTFTKACV
jgi:hypothetical protein